MGLFQFISKLASSSNPNSSLFFFRACLIHNLSSRPFPDYSPKKPTIRDSELTNQITTTIKQRRSEPLRRVLKPYESKFKPHNLIWVLINIKKDYKLVLDFFDWACLRKNPSIESLCIVIQIAVASRDLKTARRLIWDFLMKPNLDVSVVFAHFVERLIYVYKDWGSNPFVFDILFQVLVEFGLLDEARKLFDKMLNYGVIMSVDSCNLFLSRLPKNDVGVEMALKIFSEFPEVGVCWNTASHNIVIHSLCRLGKVKEAHQLFIQMELRGCVPDVISYSTVINGYCQAGEFQTVLKLVEEMQTKGLKPNPNTFNSIIILLCKSGKVVDAEMVLREMLRQGVLPDNVVYTTLIGGFCKAGSVSAAYNLLEEMQNSKIIPDFVTYTAIISARNMKEAWFLHREMAEKGYRLTVSSYNALIKGFFKRKKFLEARKLFEEMRREGLVADRELYNIFVDMNYSEGNMDITLELCDEAIEKCLIDKSNKGNT
ncbi:Pentatricopeptide repeat-containing protein [Camellia lanceoleosa]|uniref:Pentatricopeptide repeat-containing protein n=1 Tax=Camellia lanceoleosa TaxID=1840588 RepID=A0ACC0FPS5_9ERIC|nr:Pentatricopeptide repeat-containing protein [Camellia lanceoleosa]